ncbi:hypothetical protein F2Q69_00022401 [Brassica cretica]|uniref:Uncharacterized protein n=1 Tax=Brassica cretica TaxID=69181 RepID=A0A8S9QC50_BRACR|nr:hypothetical protein F2Q69_00022401 [Brassica cretica]
MSWKVHLPQTSDWVSADYSTDTRWRTNLIPSDATTVTSCSIFPDQLVHYLENLRIRLSILSWSLVYMGSDSSNKSGSFELSFQCHRFEDNPHPVAEVMHVLLKRSQSASREEVVGELMECRSTVHT